MIKLLANSILALTMLVTPISAMSAGVATITGDNVNVRSDANTTSKVYATVAEGSQFTVIGTQGDFYIVDYIDCEAYINNQFIKFLEAELIVKADTINIRKATDENSEIIRQAKKGEKLVAVAASENNKWYKVKLGINYGYVYKDYVEGEFLSKLIIEEMAKIETTYALVTASGTLNIRTSPSTDAQKAGTLVSGAVVDVIEQANNGEWLKIKTDGGLTGYVSAEFVSVRRGVKPARSSSSKGQEIVEYASQFKGTPYKWGGTNLKSGVDCSGFVYAVFKDFGISLSRTSSSMPNDGTKISKADLQAGDLVFFDTKGSNNGNICHVGIYAGGGSFIHSSSGKTKGVIVSDLTSGFYKNSYVTACRVLK